ncbi:sulfatase [Clostridium boliviensis]|uniref:Sulfatase n=1 Tax=Clostridium boliviensis TaxID=318465 RepID=A0ABU4GHZ2_9CLOT|nr:sulfatase [Clostridium boliviensis]MDW2796605.1 sulfatase [Clostridium boliviensis]
MNIVYIHTHDSGRVMSPYGYRTVTPHLEKFAEDSLTFENCYCAGPTCSPSRAAMLTGMYPHQSGMLGLTQRGFSIDYSKHLVQFLNRNGYHTALSGIQHESGWYLDIEGNGKRIGYQEVLTASNAGIRDEDLIYWDKKNARKACEWLKDYKGEKPFFLSYGMFSTHRVFPDKIDGEISEGMAVPPYPIHNNPDTRHDYARYLTSLKSADECFGQVLNSIRETGHMEDTVILFTTDHGLAAPYCKCTLFDSGIGVSFIMRVPGSPANGAVSQALISQVDLFPTLCDLLNLEKPEYLEGISFADRFLDPCRKSRDEIYAEINFHTSYEPARCIRTERYKYIRYYDQDYLKINKSNIDESEMKDYYMSHDLEQQIKYGEGLYDLLYDPGERNNLVGNETYLNILRDLKQRLDAQMNKTGDFLLKGHPEIQKNWKVNKKECQKASSKNPDDYISLGASK